MKPRDIRAIERQAQAASNDGCHGRSAELWSQASDEWRVLSDKAAVWVVRFLYLSGACLALEVVAAVIGR